MFLKCRKLKIISLFILVLNIVGFTSDETYPFIDSAQYYYSIAAKNYDVTLLEKSAGYITSQSTDMQQKRQALLIIGLIYWRMELIAYCTNATPQIKKYGNLAIEKLNNAEKAGADIYMTSSHKALVCQLLASLGITEGTINGPRAASELKNAQRVSPQGYYSLFVEAINLNQAPSFAGGNPQKAAVLLSKLAETFPDSIDVKIHLSDAYIKTGRKEDARRLLLQIIKASPSNLLAKKVVSKLPAK